MKLLVPCSSIDLKYKLGCTPSWWQLLKALHEAGNEIILTPYLGDPVESLWWRTYPNPCSFESKIFNYYLDRKKKNGRLASRKESSPSLITKAVDRFVNGKWEAHILNIMEIEKDVDAILFMNVPLNHISGIAEKVRSEYGIPVAYFDGDMPTILPKYAVKRGFKLNYYCGADLSEFDLFFTNSKGVTSDLVEMGAREVIPLYYAVDPAFFRPIDIEKTIDISFFGYGSEFREEWMRKMITAPSVKCPKYNFCVGGKGFSIDLGCAKAVGDMSYSSFRNFCSKSTICLNITRWSHTNVFASSTARPFELAGFGACIVSQPYSGIEEWFDIGKEIIVVNDEEEAMSAYCNLIERPDDALAMGELARTRVLRDHTYTNRAEIICERLGSC